jgi:hypothetical protein
MSVDHAEQRESTAAADPARRTGGRPPGTSAATLRTENRRIRTGERPPSANGTNAAPQPAGPGRPAAARRGAAAAPPAPSGPAATAGPSPDDVEAQRKAAERRRRRALFLKELKEARELRARVQPRRARAARMRQQMRMRTFRW